MAHLRDFLPAVRSRGPWKFIMLVVREISRDHLTTQAAAVAYAWLFALFPFILFLITLFAYIPERHKVQPESRIYDAVRTVVAHDAAETIVVNLKQVLHEPRSGLMSIGLIVTLWVASGGMSMTMTALDTAFDARSTWPFYIQRPIAILLTVVVTVLIVIVLLLLPVGTAIEEWLAATNQIPERVLWVLNLARYVLAIFLLQAVLSLLYKFGTRAPRPMVFFSPGSIFTIVVWLVLGGTFRYYVDRFGSYQKTYGAVGGVAILLLFFYLDALVLLIGAEINSQVDRVVRERTMDD
jgi:membrane protein